MVHVANVAIQASQVTADQTDFPVLVDLGHLPASFWNTVAAGGGDIRVFKADGTTELPREVVSCDAGTGELWIKHSGTLSSSSDTIIQIHADGSSSDYAATATYGRNAVWADYQAVFHGDDGVDSAGNSADLTAYGSTSFGAAGQVGKAFAIPAGNNNHVSVTSSGIGDLTTSTDLTIQGIVYRSSNTASDSYEEVYASIARPDGFTVGLELDEALTLYTDGGNTDGRSPAQRFPLAAWIQWHVAWSQTGQSVGHYVNGQLDGSLLTGYTDRSSQNNPNIFLGSADGYVTDGLDGLLDEFRIRYGILSDDWIATEHNNQSSPSTFYAVEAVEPDEGEPVNQELVPVLSTSTAQATALSAGYSGSLLSALATGSEQALSLASGNSQSITPLSASAQTQAMSLLAGLTVAVVPVMATAAPQGMGLIAGQSQSLVVALSPVQSTASPYTMGQAIGQSQALTAEQSSAATQALRETIGQIQSLLPEISQGVALNMTLVTGNSIPFTDTLDPVKSTSELQTFTLTSGHAGMLDPAEAAQVAVTLGELTGQVATLSPAVATAAGQPMGFFSGVIIGTFKTSSVTDISITYNATDVSKTHNATNISKTYTATALKN